MIHPFKGSRPSSKKDMDAIKVINEIAFNDEIESTDHFAEICDFITVNQSQYIQDSQPCYYIYRLKSQYGCQTGLIALVQLDNEISSIHPHENIKKNKSEAYANFLSAQNIQANPVILLHHFLKSIQTLLDELTERQPDLHIDSTKECDHKLWVVHDPNLIALINKNYRFITNYYIGDGHHRYYAAKLNLGDKSKSHLLSWLISDNQARILPYHWIIPTLGSIDKTTFFNTINEYFEVSNQFTSILPKMPDQLGLYIDKNWYQLKIKSSKSQEPIGILMQELLNQKLAIKNIIKVPVDIEKLASLTNELSYELLFTFPEINVSEFMHYISAGFTLPERSTFFVPKPALGLITYCSTTSSFNKNASSKFLNKDSISHEA